MTDLVYVLPVHNEERLLVGNVGRLVAYLDALGGADVYLVENGSRDRSWELAGSLEAKDPAPGKTRVRAFQEPNQGIGWAYHRGLTEAVTAFGPSSRHWALLTAADLPFGFSDLEAAFVPLDRGESRILMGSKAHPDSVAERGPTRRVMSNLYAFARRSILDMRVGDSQGSVFLRLDLAAELLPKIVARDFFYTTELCHYAERAGETIVELPVILAPSERASTVKPVKDGVEMARQLLRLRRRHAADRRPR